jgi:hypothetical protein
MLVNKHIYKTGFITLWLTLALLGSLYVAGEEVSWGQHLFGWGTPDQWSQYNDQAETNLHNTSSWLDQKPRLILILGVFLGALVFPYLNNFLARLPKDWRLLIPPKEAGGLAILALLPYGINKLLSQPEQGLFVRYSEIQEVFLFAFVFFYLLELHHRLGKRKSA